MTVSVPNTFVNGTAADADEVNQNFDAVVGYINTEIPLLTGERSYTGALDFANFKALRMATPTEATDGANKQYADSVIPVGAVEMFAGPDAKIPAKWVKCNGQALSRSTYSDLFNVIGTGYGPGDGVNTFNVPNFFGAAATGTPNADGVLRFPYPAAPGVRGGSHDAIVVAHDHTVPAHQHTGPSHTHSVSGTAASGGDHNHGWPAGRQFWYKNSNSGLGINFVGPGATFWDGATSANWAASGNHTHSVSGTAAAGGTGLTGLSAEGTTGQKGDSGVGANIPAFLGINIIIRTGV